MSNDKQKSQYDKDDIALLGVTNDKDPESRPKKGQESDDALAEYVQALVNLHKEDPVSSMYDEDFSTQAVVPSGYEPLTKGLEADVYRNRSRGEVLKVVRRPKDLARTLLKRKEELLPKLQEACKEIQEKMGYTVTVEPFDCVDLGNFMGMYQRFVEGEHPNEDDTRYQRIKGFLQNRFGADDVDMQTKNFIWEEENQDSGIIEVGFARKTAGKYRLIDY